MRSIILCSAFSVLCYFALGQPLFDGEFMIDTSARFGAAQEYQTAAAVAFDGVNDLVVWEDSRGGFTNIYGARIGPAGDVLDRAGIAVSPTENIGMHPAVAFDGANYLVVWSDGRVGRMDRDIYGARVTPDGTVLDPGGFLVADDTSDQAYPAVTYDGASFLVVWEAYRSGGSDVRGARVTPDAHLLDTAGFTICTGPWYRQSPVAAFNGTDFLVAWEDGRSGVGYGIYAARVTSDGRVLNPDGFVVSTASDHQQAPRVATIGPTALVVWRDMRRGAAIYGARVSEAGAVLDSAGFAISLQATYPGSPAVAGDGTRFLVTWHEFRTGGDLAVSGARVTPEGVVLDSAGITISVANDDRYYAAVAAGAAGFLAAWQDSRIPYDYDIFCARIASDGIVLDSAGTLVSTSPECQQGPAIAAGDANFLVAWDIWQKNRYPDSMPIRGGRVAPDGTVLDSSGIALAAPGRRLRTPAAAWGDSVFLAVWAGGEGGGHVYGTRVTRAGIVLDSAGIAISPAAWWQSLPAAAWDGTNFLVVWLEDRDAAFEVRGSRVTPSGQVLDTTGIAIAPATRDRYPPAVAFDGDNYLAVWEDTRRGDTSDIYGARVSRDGVVLDSAGIVISAGRECEEEPAVAFGGSNYLAVWTDHRVVGSGVYGARVTRSGVVLDTQGIAVSMGGVGSDVSPAVAFDGANFLVVWASMYGSRYFSDIHGAHVSPAGLVIDSASVATQEGHQLHPALTRGVDGRMLLAYHGWAGMVGGVAYNNYRVWGKLDPFVGFADCPTSRALHRRLGASIISGVLMMPRDMIEIRSGSSDRVPRPTLLDAIGRKVMELQPGPNDVRHLAAGVYFLKPMSRDSTAARKLVVQR